MFIKSMSNVLVGAQMRSGAGQGGEGRGGGKFPCGGEGVSVGGRLRRRRRYDGAPCSLP